MPVALEAVVLVALSAVAVSGDEAAHLRRASVLVPVAAAWAWTLRRQLLHPGPSFRPPPAWRLPGAGGWGLLVAAVTAFQLANFTSHPRATHPTLSSLLNVAFEHYGIRVAAFAAWLASAVWLLRRW